VAQLPPRLEGKDAKRVHITARRLTREALFIVDLHSARYNNCTFSRRVSNPFVAENSFRPSNAVASIMGSRIWSMVILSSAHCTSCVEKTRLWFVPAPESFRRKPLGRGSSELQCSAQRLPYNSSAMTDKVICVVRAPEIYRDPFFSCFLASVLPPFHFACLLLLKAFCCLAGRRLSTLCILPPLF
jgi:hypothetical protein